MILTKYIFKEIFKTQMICFIVLFSVFMCQTVIKLLSKASAGTMPVDVVSEMVLYSMPSVGFILLPLTLYVGIIIALSRMSSDSEMVVMKSTGVSSKTFMKIAMVLASMTAAITAYNSFVLMPRATLEQKILREASQNDPQYLPIESGKFTNFGDYTIYIQKVTGQKSDRNLGQVFIFKDISLVQGLYDELMCVIADSGNVKFDENGTQWVTLYNGNSYKTQPFGGDFKKFNFKTFSVPVASESNSDYEDETLQSTPTSVLWDSDDRKAKVELQWRAAPVLACFILAIIAIPLSMINPRQGKFSRLGPAIILFAAYYMCLLSLRNFINADKFWLIPGLYFVPIAFFFFVAIPINMEKTYIRRKNKAKA